MLRNGFYTASETSQNMNVTGLNMKASQEDTQTIRSETSSTLSLDRPFCKICHIGSSKQGDKLISPCKCSGTMRYIHCACLLKWLEMSNRANEKPMSCELCGHEYTWHKKFNFKQMQLPKCSFRDIIYHTVFVLAIACMIISASAPLSHRAILKPQTDSPESQVATSNSDTTNRIFQRHSSQSYHNPASYHHIAKNRLDHEEKLMLVCAAAFFISFFLAIYVQTKSRDTLYGVLAKFLAANQTYYITEYNHGVSLSDSNRNNNISSSTSDNVNCNIMDNTSSLQNHNTNDSDARITLSQQSQFQSHPQHNQPISSQRGLGSSRVDRKEHL